MIADLYRHYLWTNWSIDLSPGRSFYLSVIDVCEGFFCPSLGTRDDYRQWMEEAGFVVERSDLWTERVTRTWEICAQRVRWTGVGLLGRIVDRNTDMFLRRFETILAAYRTGAMEYGCFVARKPVV